MDHLSVILVGDQDKIERELEKYTYDKERITIEHAPDTIDMDEKDNPAMAVRKKPLASMNVALNLVKEGRADANVSAGNTGALMTASQLKLKRIKGVLRPAITTVFPSENGHFVMLDAGANAECKAEYLDQFAVMATEYSKALLGTENPKVGLLNIGEEDGKGNELTKEAFKLLVENKKINFTGNIESRDMMDGAIDVVVTDGFTGNIVLKTAEGTAMFILEFLKKEIPTKLMYKIGALLLKPVFKKLKLKMDSTEYGGALFLGLNGISVKAHGNSDSKAFKNAIQVAEKFAEVDLVGKVKDAVN